MHLVNPVSAQGTLKKLTRILMAGLVISFLGSLPLGTMNIAATQVSIGRGIGAGWQYAVGSMLIEIMIVRVALAATGWLHRRQRMYRLLQLFSIGLLVAMAAGSFLAAYNRTGFSSSLPGIVSAHPFWTGVLLSISNPMHIPFWLGWSTVLTEKGILLDSSSYYRSYIAGIGAGTLLGFAVFIYGGNYMVTGITHHQALLSLLIGIVLLATVVIQVRRIMTVPLYTASR